MTAKKPMNVIILTSDEMRGDCPSFMGNPDCQTPNLDRLAGRGVAFTNHFTVHGKCVPSRIAMETGRYCHTDGYRTITQHMPDDQPNLLGKLKALGYESAVFGHNHVWDTLFASNKKGEGYSDYHSFTEDYFAPLLEKEWPVPEPGPDAREPLPIADGPEEMPRPGRIESPLTFFCDDNRAEQAVHYLKNIRDRERPFYLHVNMGKPHPPYKVEEPYYSMYDPKRIKPWTHALPENAPLPVQKMREIRTGLEASEDLFLEMQAVYYGMVTKVDTHFGRIMDAIDEENLWDDTIVIFWVDHGDFAGQYGLIEKWDTSMADCILHVPQIICAPGLPAGKRVDSLTEHVDITPTILELLGVEPDWGIHGESLLPFINGEKKKDAIFADGGHEREMWGRFDFEKIRESKGDRPLSGKQIVYRDHPESMARTKMVRTEKWKLVIREVGGNELYDLENDPDELHNLYSENRHAPTVADLQLKMIEWCLRTDTDRPRQEKVGA